MRALFLVRAFAPRLTPIGLRASRKSADALARVLSIAVAVLLSCSACSDDSGDASGGQGSSGASSSSGSSGTPEVDAEGSTAHELCFNTINEYRKAKGLEPYARWTDGESCADGEAKSDSETGRAHGAFPRCKEMAQNECPGHPGPPEKALPRCLKMMMDEGPGGGHYDTMTSTKYKQAACGIFVTASGSVWSVQNFR